MAQTNRRGQEHGLKTKIQTEVGDVISCFFFKMI